MHLRQARLSKFLLDANLSPETREFLLPSTDRRGRPGSSLRRLQANRKQLTARHYPRYRLAPKWHPIPWEPWTGRTMTPANTPHGRLPACYVPLTAPAI